MPAVASARSRWCVMLLASAATAAAEKSHHHHHAVQDNPTRWLRVEQELGLSADPLIHPSFQAQLRWLKTKEPVAVAMFNSVFSSDACSRGEGVFVDSGANEGAFSLLAASRGCCAVAVEPQPGCQSLLLAALDRNRKVMASNGKPVSQNMAVCARTLSAKPMVTKVEVKGCLPNAQYTGGLMNRGEVEMALSGLNATAAHMMKVKYAEQLSNGLIKSKSVSSVALDDLLESKGLQLSCSVVGQTCQPAAGAPGRIMLWHLDVEGAEIPVLRSAAHLIARGDIQRIMLEFFPSRWPAFNISVAEGLAELSSLFHGWHCVVMCTGERYDFSRPTLLGPGKKDVAIGLCVDVYCTSESQPMHDTGLKAIRAMARAPRFFLGNNTTVHDGAQDGAP